MIIGTTALDFHGVHLREPADVDYMTCDPDYNYFSNLYKRGIIMSTALKGSEALAILEEIVAAFNEENDTSYGASNWKFLDELWEDDIPDGFCMIEEEGGECEGDYAYKVFVWKKQHYELISSYQSYTGFNYNYAELYEVTKQQKPLRCMNNVSHKGKK